MKAEREIVLKFEVEDRVYRMTMPGNAPLGESYQASSAFLDEIVRLINEHAEKRAQANKDQEEEE